MTNIRLANYTQQQTLLTNFVQSEQAPNILLFEAESGSGKSALIGQGLNPLPKEQALHHQLEGEADSVSTLFANLGNQYGWQNLPTFTEMLATLLEEPEKANDLLWQAGIRRHLKRVGKLRDLESRLSRYQLLSDAWFTDLQQQDTPFVLAVDGYEKASPLFDQWFSEDFLPGVAHSHKMKVIVAGWTMPTKQEGWRFSAIQEKLSGVHDCGEWLTWGVEAGYQIPSEEAIQPVVMGLGGNPELILRVITAYKQSETAVQLTDSILAFQNHLRRSILQTFNMEELIDVCFMMGINHEDIPNRGRFKSFVRELISFAHRAELLEKLAEVCAKEKPNHTWTLDDE